MADWDADITLTPELAADLIRREWPDLASEPIRPITAGWDNYAFRVGEHALFRFPRRSAFAHLLETEIAVLPRISNALPCKISVPTWIGPPTRDFSYTFAGYPYIAGDTACRANPPTEELAHELGAFLRALHSVDVDTLGNALPKDTIRRSDLPYRLTRMKERIDAIASQLTEAQRRSIISEMETLALAPPSSQKDVPVHGDLYVRHLILNANGTLAGVIDFGDIHRGDPALDLSVGLAYLPRRLHRAFFAEYGSVDDATMLRARFRAIHSTLWLIHYGTSTADEPLVKSGRTALAHLELM